MNDKDLAVEVVENMFDEKTTEVFRYLLENRREAVDEEIARELGLKLNDVRRALYLLSEQGLISYRRVRDRNTGWYIYYWSVNRGQIPQIIKHRKRITLEKLRERLRYEEENEFYTCPREGIRYTFDEALENEFKCYSCGEPLVHLDNSDVIDFLRKKISELEEMLKSEDSKKK